MTDDVVTEYTERIKDALPLEAEGIAWRAFDARTGDFVWRFREKRWCSVSFPELFGSHSFEAFHQDKLHDLVRPYFRRNTFFCCRPEEIPNERSPDGPTIEEQVWLAEQMLEAQLQGNT